MLLARHGWAVAACGRLGLGAREGAKGLLVLSNYQWRFNNVCYKSYRVMNPSKDWPIKSGENKKRKIIAPVWRSTSIQSSSAFCSMEPTDGYHPEKKLNFDRQYAAQRLETVCDITRTAVQSSAVDCCDQAEVSEDLSVMSASTEAETVLNESVSLNMSVEKEVKERTSCGLNIALDTFSVPKNDRHSMSVEVGSLARFVKGKWGFTQRRIEEEFEVKIIFPYSKMDSSILLEGRSSVSVYRASEKVKTILDEAVKRVDFSHFVSLPLSVHQDLVEKTTDFQNAILGDEFMADRNTAIDLDEDCVDNEDVDGLPEGSDVAVKVDVKQLHTRAELGTPRSTESNNSSADMGIDKSIFLKPKQLHLTVLMLKLHKKDRIALAAEVLQKVLPKVMDVLDHRPISIRLKGLACMRGSPAKAHVLYVPVEEIGGDERLTRACQVIIDAYLEAGLVLREDAQAAQQTLKLHATLMNTRQRKRTGSKKKLRPDPFDARDIFKKYGSMEWGEYVLQEVHLSQRFIYDENGYYHCCGSIPLPQSTVTE